MILLAESTHENNFNALMAGNPSKLFLVFFTMKTGWVHFYFL